MKLSRLIQLRNVTFSSVSMIKEILHFSFEKCKIRAIYICQYINLCNHLIQSLFIFSFTNHMQTKLLENIFTESNCYNISDIIIW